MTSICTNSDLILSHLSVLNKKSLLIIDLKAGDRLDCFMEGHLLVFLLEGVLQFSLNKTDVRELKAPSVFLIKRGSFYERVALENSRIAILSINHYRDIGNISTLESLKVKSGKKESLEESASLVLTPVIRKFFDILIDTMELGITEDYYFNLKIKELALIIEREYSKTEWTGFLSQLVSNEETFLDFIYENFRKVKSVADLVALSNYSHAGFEKKFRKAFGVTPSKWRKRHLTFDVYNELTKTPKTFKEISLDYGFSSPAHLNKFCKDTLGGTPGELRKRLIIPDKFQIIN